MSPILICWISNLTLEKDSKKINMIYMIAILFTLAVADFGEWYKKFGKFMTMYSITKEESRKAYEENKKFILDFNNQNHSYTLSLNGRWVGFPRSKIHNIFRPRYNKPLRRQSDPNEYKLNKQCLEYYDSNGNVINASIFPNISPQPQPPVYDNPYVDWREKMSPVRDQGSCGGCYTFGSVGALEGLLNIDYNRKFDLAEQQVIDCSKEYGNNGCSGGLGGNVYNYLLTHSLAYEYDYPFTGSTGQCKASFPTHVQLKTYTCGLYNLPGYLQNGPVDIAMYVAGSFMYYSSGFYDGKGDGCTNNIMQTNHEMIAVGYGRNQLGVPYFIIRNSWGSSWGMDGYAYVLTGTCSVDTDPEVPLQYELK